MPPMARTLLLALAVVALAVAGEWLLARVYGEEELTCRQTSLPVPLPDLPEASGIAASRRSPGVFWAISDSGQPIVTALADTGEVRGHVRVAGATVEDWEDVSVGPCGDRTCLYIADIGDNQRRRNHVTIYRVPEPAPGDRTTPAAEVITARYPDGAHDAETLVVTPDGAAFVVTKEKTAIVYRLPSLEPGTEARLQETARLPLVDATGGGTSANGKWAALRSGDELRFYSMAEFTAGRFDGGVRVKTEPFGEPQGEGITFGRNGAIYLAGEGGGRKAPGTLVSIECALPTVS
jgi:hypothetical protein